MTDSIRNPLVLAILGATLAAIGNAAVVLVNGNLTRHLEAEKAEQARILEVIKTGDPDKAATNLGFLAEVGLISDHEVATRVLAFLSARPSGTGPVLPTPSPPAIGALGEPVVENARVYLLAGNTNNVHTFEMLREELVRSGYIVLGQKVLPGLDRPTSYEIRYFNSSDKEQAEGIAAFVGGAIESKEPLEAVRYNDASARPGYIEVWLGR